MGIQTDEKTHRSNVIIKGAENATTMNIIHPLLPSSLLLLFVLHLITCATSENDESDNEVRKQIQKKKKCLENASNFDSVLGLRATS